MTKLRERDVLAMIGGSHSDRCETAFGSLRLNDRSHRIQQPMPKKASVTDPAPSCALDGEVVDESNKESCGVGCQQ